MTLARLLQKFVPAAKDAAAPADTAETRKNLGNAHLAKGELNLAADCYRRAIDLDPDYPDAHNNLGFVCLQQQRFDEAERHLARAVSLNPRLPNAHYNLGTLCLRQRRLDQALACFQAALALDPGNAEFRYSVGNVLYELGRIDEAQPHLHAALAIAPQHANALNCLGLAFQKQARLDDAIDCYSRAVAASPQFAIAHYNLGFLLRLRGRHSDALVSLQKAAVLQPSLAEAHYELGNLYSDQGRQAEAAEHYEKVVALWPDHADARNNLGLTFLRRDMLDEAAACFEEAIRLKPQSMAAHNNLGDIRHKQGRLNEALACADTAIGLAPEVAGLYITKGIVLQDMGRFDEAEACYARAQALEPEVRTWQFNHALLLLLRGRLAEGWKQYESRFYPGSPARAIGFPQPQWAGESLEGKSLLIWEDQGIGDEILFASQFAELAARAGRCVIECAPKLVSLFARSFPGAQVVPRTSPPHRAMQEGIDFQISAGSLARWLRPTIEAFPRQQGYLLPDAERLAHWKKRLAELGPDLKVGICWRSKLRGGLRHLHYTALDDWGPILTVPGVRFVNLQYDDCAAEIAAAKRRFGISVQVFEEVDLFDDLDEAAALIGALDLVVTAPTAVSRLAAAQGIPTWEMSYGHSWVSLGTNHVPWLPAHRQHARRWDQPWSEIIAAIGDDLKLAAAQRAE